MKTTCPHCQKAAAIYDASQLTPNRSTLLVQCEDIRLCGSRSVYAVSVKKSLQRSLLRHDEQSSHPDGLVSENFRVNCPHCGNPATLYSRYNVTNVTSDIYCRCTHESCQAKFVIDLAYQSTVLPPINGIEQIALHILKSAPKKRRVEFQLSLEAFAV